MTLEFVVEVDGLGISEAVEVARGDALFAPVETPEEQAASTEIKNIEVNALAILGNKLIYFI